MKLGTNEEETPFVTDHGNLILDCNFGSIARPFHRACRIKERTEIIEHGLFVELTTDLIVAAADGVRHVKK